MTVTYESLIAMKSHRGRAPKWAPWLAENLTTPGSFVAIPADMLPANGVKGARVSILKAAEDAGFRAEVRTFTEDGNEVSYVVRYAAADVPQPSAKKAEKKTAKK